MDTTELSKPENKNIAPVNNKPVDTKTAPGQAVQGNTKTLSPSAAIADSGNLTPAVDSMLSKIVKDVKEILPQKQSVAQVENKNVGAKTQTEIKAPQPTKPLETEKAKQAAVGGAASPRKKEKPTPLKDEKPPAQRYDVRKRKNEKVVFIKHSELHAPKNHPFGVRDDSEMKALVESVRSIGVTQPGLVRPLEQGGYELVCGNRRQRANELAGNDELPCIVRELTDDEAILAMTDDNLRQRSKILPSEKAASLKMQVDAIKHRGVRNTEALNISDDESGKRSIEIVGRRNAVDGKPMTGKQVQRYICLTNLIPELQKAIDDDRLGFTSAIEISFIKSKNQDLIAVALESLQIKPSESQAKRLRALDKDDTLNGDMIDGILSEEKKEEIKVIISGAELEKYFSKDKTPREMKDQIIKLLDDWAGKEKTVSPPEKKAPDRDK